MNGRKGKIRTKLEVFFLRNRILRLMIIVIPVIMGGLGVVLLIAGILATGATRHHVYTGFRSRLTGRISTGFVSKQRKINSSSNANSFFPSVDNHCLHILIDLVIDHVEYGHSMYCIVYSEISLCGDMDETNGI